MPILPAFMVNADDPAQARPDTCLGTGLVPNAGGFNSSLPRFWCSGPNHPLGCPGFDAGQVATDLAIAANARSCQANLTSAPCDAEMFRTNATFHEDLAGAVEILSRAREGEAETCPDLGDAELNACLAGPINDFPGLIPLVYLSGLAVLSYLSFIVAEVFFGKHDTKGWRDAKPALDDEAAAPQSAGSGNSANAGTSAFGSNTVVDSSGGSSTSSGEAVVGDDGSGVDAKADFGVTSVTSIGTGADGNAAGEGKGVEEASVVVVT